jgi:hypothetical protein
MQYFSLSRLFSSLNEASFRFAFHASQALTNESAFDIPHSQVKSSRFKKFAEKANKTKKNIQRKAFANITHKAGIGDFHPKPVGNVAIALAKESIFLLSKSGPLVAKAASNPLSVGFFMAAGAATMVFIDDSSRQLITDQVSQVFALFQNENGKSTPATGEQIDNTEQVLPATHETPQPYKHPNYYL